MQTTRDTTAASAPPDRRRYPLTGQPARRPGGGHRITKAQNALYWREWAAARRTLLHRGYSHEDADAERHIIHAEAIGADKSHAEFTNRDLDAVLAAFRGISTGAVQFATGTQRRLMFAIRRLAGGREDYIKAICLDTCGHDQWQHLTDDELQKLRITLTHRIERKPAP